MSNRDGKNAKRKKGDKVSLAKRGNPCPRCSAKENKSKKSKRNIIFDLDGGTKPVHSKVTKLSRAYCAQKKGHEHHVHCHSCNWTNF